MIHMFRAECLQDDFVKLIGDGGDALNMVGLVLTKQYHRFLLEIYDMIAGLTSEKLNEIINLYFGEDYWEDIEKVMILEGKM